MQDSWREKGWRTLVQQTKRQPLGTPNILTERMPPSGWSDVARKQDITNIHKELTGINGTLKVIIGGVLTVSAAIIVLLIQLNQNVSHLDFPNFGGSVHLAVHLPTGGTTITNSEAQRFDMQVRLRSLPLQPAKAKH